MKAKLGTNPKEYLVVLAENFMENLEKKSEGKSEFQMPEIDIVAGATSSNKKFKKMMEFLVEKAESGEIGNHMMKL